MNKFDNTIHSFYSLEEMAMGRSLFHAIHPVLKILLTLFYIAVVLSVPRYALSSACVFFVYPAVVIPLSDLTFKPFLKRLLIALPFVLFAGISNILLNQKILLVVLGMKISAGLLSCLVLIVKAVLCVLATLLLAATTPFPALFSQLRRFGVPKALIMTILLCLRYLVLLMEEAKQMTLAYHLRGSRQKGIDMRHMGSFVGQLLLRSFDRAERVYRAMMVRGNEMLFGDENEKKPSLKQFCAIIGICLVIAFFRVFTIEYLLSLVIR